MSEHDVLEALPGCPGAWTDCAFPNEFNGPGGSSHIFRLPALFSGEEVASIIESVEGEGGWSLEPCSTDKKPAYEKYLLRDGNTSLARAEPFPHWGVIESRLANCVVPLVRAQFDCPACVVCTSLIRRYSSDERVEVPPHRDSKAAVTLVVELQKPSEGGLYVKTRAADEPAFTLMESGEAIVHDYRLLHGVRVKCDPPSCTRYSFITWFQRHRDACEAGNRWVSSSRQAQVDYGFDIFVKAARVEMGSRFNEKHARYVFEAFLDAGGGISSGERYAAALGALRSGSEFVKTRNAEIDKGLDRFVDAARRTLKTNVKRSAARRALRMHSDERGALDKDRFFSALATLRGEREEL